MPSNSTTSSSLGIWISRGASKWESNKNDFLFGLGFNLQPSFCLSTMEISCLEFAIAFSDTRDNDLLVANFAGELHTLHAFSSSVVTNPSPATLPTICSSTHLKYTAHLLFDCFPERGFATGGVFLELSAFSMVIIIIWTFIFSLFVTIPSVTYFRQRIATVNLSICIEGP
eukprot:Gb_00791 [translate_table: standard]